MSVRADLRADRHRCPSCHRLLAEATDVRRVVTGQEVDVLVICDGCGQPTVIPWVREAV